MSESNRPARDHSRPPGVDDTSVEATGKLSEGLEYLHRARGALYEAHQLIGRADFLFEEGAGLLRDAGHDELAARVETEVVGRNVLPGRWTFQIVEEFDATYYEPVGAVEEHVRTELLAGRHHVYESEMKDRRRTVGEPGHERRPADV
jgi:hypothetical protein